MNAKTRRIAVNVGSQFIPGMNSVFAGVALAAAELDWEVVGIRNGFAGLLDPDDFPDGGLVDLSPTLLHGLDRGASGLLGQSSQFDPFHRRQEDEDGMLVEVDRTDDLLAAFKEHGIDALVSVAGGRSLSVLYKLHRKGLNAVCIPRSVENDIATTMVSFGFNTALSVTIEMLDRAHQAATSSGQIGVVEVPGEHAGWLALQSGIATGADVILIPEVPIDFDAV
ncbi:MAG: 6-phosphofructokinase, partial [Woeseiaceae bacterium]